MPFLTKEATAIPTGDNNVFISSNSENEGISPVDSSDTDLAVISTKPKVSGNDKLCMTIVIIMMLVWSYLVHIMMTILSISITSTIFYKIINSNKEINKNFEKKMESHQIKMKLPQQGIQTPKNDNKNLKEENKSHPTIEFLLVGHNSQAPTRNYITQICINTVLCFKK